MKSFRLDSLHESAAVAPSIDAAWCVPNGKDRVGQPRKV